MITFVMVTYLTAACLFAYNRLQVNAKLLLFLGKKILKYEKSRVPKKKGRGSTLLNRPRQITVSYMNMTYYTCVTLCDSLFYTYNIYVLKITIRYTCN